MHALPRVLQMCKSTLSGKNRTREAQAAITCTDDANGVIMHNACKAIAERNELCNCCADTHYHITKEADDVNQLQRQYVCSAICRRGRQQLRGALGQAHDRICANPVIHEGSFSSASRKARAPTNGVVNTNCIHAEGTCTGGCRTLTANSSHWLAHQRADRNRHASWAGLPRAFEPSCLLSMGKLADCHNARSR